MSPDERLTEAVRHLRAIRDDPTTPMNTAADLDQVIVEVLLDPAVRPEPGPETRYLADERIERIDLSVAEPEPTGLMHLRIFGLMPGREGRAPLVCPARAPEVEAANDPALVTCPDCKAVIASWPESEDLAGR